MVKQLRDIKPKTPTQKPNTIWKLKAKPKKSYFIGLIIIFFVLFNLFGIVIQGKNYINLFANNAKQGISSLLSAKDKIALADFDTAQIAFTEAETIFKQLNQDTWFLQGNTKTPQALLESAKLISESGKMLAALAVNFKTLPDQFIQANAAYLQDKSSPKVNLTQPIVESLPILQKVNQNMELVNQNLSSVSTTFFPEDIQNQIEDAKVQVADLSQTLESFTNYLNIVLDLLGSQVPHTYLILIQNNYEARPAGGFLGSMVFAEVDNGILTQFDFKDIYDFDGIFTQNPDYLPPEYTGLNQKLWIRDANYTPDFPISASRIETLLQRANAPSFDTIISIDQTLIEELLGLTGPVLMPEYNAEISAKTYFSVFTYLIEANQKQNANDKQILADFMREFEKKVFAVTDIKSLFNVFSSNLNKKHIQIFSKKSNIQDLITQFDFDNSFIPQNSPQENLLLVTTSSIGGNKSDKYIKERIIFNTHFKKDNSIQNSITVRKFHSYSDLIERSWTNSLIPFGVTQIDNPSRYVLGRGNNISMMKVYVPNDSVLISTKGVPLSQVETHTDPDLNQKYFMFKLSTKPGQFSQATLIYEPNIKLKPNPVAEYSLNLQMQAGTHNTTFQKTYTFQDPTEQRILDQIPDITGFDEQNRPFAEFELESDMILNAVYTKN